MTDPASVDRVAASPRKAGDVVWRAGRRWPWAPFAYRFGLVAGTLVVLSMLSWSPTWAPPWGLSWARLIPFFDPEAALNGGPSTAFAVLLVVAIATSLLTLHYPGRSDVILLPLPVGLAWWLFGPGAALVFAGLGGLLGNVLRRRPPLPAIAGAARLTLATAAALAVTGAIAGTAGLPLPDTSASSAVFGAAGSALGLTPALVLHAGAFFVVLSAVDGLLDWLDTQLAGQAAGTGRTDLVTTLALVPLAILLLLATGRLGADRLALLLVGLVALLWIVRTGVNLRTLHGALQRLHQDVAEEREKLATLIQHSGEGIYTVDERRCITSLNPAMAALLGQSPEQAQGRHCSRVCHYLDEAGATICPDRCPMRRAEREGRPISQEVVYQAPGGPAKHLLLTYAAAGGPGQPVRLGIGIARDISTQKEAERLRADFVSLITHELRSPLTVSIGYLNMLRRTLQEAGKASVGGETRVWRYLDRIEGAEQHLLRLVNSLLEMTRLEHTDLPVENNAVAVAQLVEDAFEALVPTAAAKNLALELDVPPDLPRLWSSELYLQEIVANLCSNAVKYTPAGGRVRVAVAVGPAPPPLEGDDRPLPVGEGLAPLDWLHISVADTGYGLSEEEQARLFTRFFRSNRPEVRREPGTGLGLAFTRQMVDRIGGRIDVRSVSGIGSTFTVSFPLLSPPAPAADAPQGAPQDAPQDAPQGAPQGAPDTPAEPDGVDAFPHTVQASEPAALASPPSQATPAEASTRSESDGTVQRA